MSHSDRTAEPITQPEGDRMSLERLQSLLNSSPAILYSAAVTPPYVTTFISDNVAAYTGYSAGQFLADPSFWTQRIHPQDRAGVLEQISQLSERGEVTVDYRFRHGDGLCRWMRDRMRLVRDENGLPREIAGYMMDVTDQKTAELQRAGMERQLEAFFKGATAGLSLLDKDLRFVRINDALADVNGLPSDAHIGRTLGEILPELAPMLEPSLRGVLASGEPVLNIGIAGETRSRPGILRHWVASHFPVPGVDGSPEGVGAIVVEISALKEAEQALREREGLLRQLTENIREVFWLSSVDHRQVLYVNQAFEDIWGRSRESLYRDARVWLEAIHPEDRPRIAAERAGDRGDPFVREYRILRPDGTLRWIRARGFSVLDEQGKPYRIAGLGEDITEERRIQSELQEANRSLRELIAASPLAIVALDREGVVRL